ncbi:hypothetical protein IQ225_18535 [Synechocystis salina LEGE 06155]|uniref:hypothetical protein n=1 Tax=Synechocystis sp. LEGE 06083 TaxID=915336 RepID=UPI001880BF92|nr:hypothetical protein [Synechocystis sp. LEGE 06083]MBE9176822.1 hypothetical protein [Synechocystis salina LEGE 06155]MBE9197014.1 hypothetical protein [Synechocystis sp. LEGE 06083]
MNSKKRLAIIVSTFLLGFIGYRIFFNKIPGEVKSLTFESIKAFNTPINIYQENPSLPINGSYLQSIKDLSDKTAYFGQKYPDNPEINNCLDYIDSYNNQVLNIFTKINQTIVLSGFYELDDFEQDSTENLQTQDLMLKACGI